MGSKNSKHNKNSELSVRSEAPPSGFGVNLLEEPNFEVSEWDKQQSSSSLDVHPLDVDCEGDGSIAEKGPTGCSVSLMPSNASHCITSCSKWLKRSQTIDLSQKGVLGLLHSEPHRIKAFSWVCRSKDCLGEAYMNVSLLDEERNTVEGCCSKSIHFKPSTTKWQKIECHFDNYPTNVKFIRFEDGFSDNSVSDGNGRHFPSIKMTGATVKIVKQWKDGLFKTGNLLLNPSFKPRYPLSWQPDKTTTSINYLYWQHTDYYQLQQQKDSTGAYDPSDWCIATKDFSKRTQSIDLTDYCSVETLQSALRPRIVVNCSFSMTTDHPGRFSIEASLCDESESIIKHKGINGAANEVWGSSEIVFADYGPNARYLYYTEECHSQDEGSTLFNGLRIYQPSVKFMKGNILRNNVFSPKSHTPLNWNHHTGDINFYPWKVTSNGKIALEKLSQNEIMTTNQESATKVHLCKPEGHGISTSCDWFVRYQEIDLIENGYQPDLLDKHQPRITIFEWYGVGYVKVDLLDACHRPLNVQFNSGEIIFASSHWAQISYAFESYPKGLRFIRFEDGGRGLDRSDGYFGPHMIGAEVMIG